MTSKDLLSYFLFCFTSLFTIVNPFGTMPVYLAFTESMERPAALRVAKNASLAAFIAMVTVAFLGNMIFNFFSISVDGLKVVGGILLFLSGYDMLHGQMSRTKAIGSDENSHVASFTITPLAIPMICGPGAITVTMVLMQDIESGTQKIILTAAVLLVCFSNFLVLAVSRRMVKLLGSSGSRIFTRIMGMITMMIAVEYFFKGLKPYVHRLLEP